MLECLAIDDEKLALDLLEDNIAQVPFCKLVKKCRNAFEAMEVLQLQKIDLIFLDIQMPGLTGLQFLQSLSYRPMAILITAYDKYAMEGYNLDVVDYLLKPVSLERFIKACNKAWELYNLKAVSGEQTLDHFFVQADYSLIKVWIKDILYIEGLRDYVKLHYLNGKFLMVRMSLKLLEEKLPSKYFIRIHKSYIVSVTQISSIRKNTVYLNQQTELPVSEQYKNALFSILEPPL